MRMKNSISLILFYTAILILIVLLILGGIKLRTWGHYKFFYKSQVQSEIQSAIVPLTERIVILERQILELSSSTNSSPSLLK